MYALIAISKTADCLNCKTYKCSECKNFGTHDKSIKIIKTYYDLDNAKEKTNSLIRKHHHKIFTKNTIRYQLHQYCEIDSTKVRAEQNKNRSFYAILETVYSLNNKRTLSEEIIKFSYSLESINETYQAILHGKLYPQSHFKKIFYIHFPIWRVIRLSQKINLN